MLLSHSHAPSSGPAFGSNFTHAITLILSNFDFFDSKSPLTDGVAMDEHLGLWVLTGFTLFLVWFVGFLAPPKPIRFLRGSARRPNLVKFPGIHFMNVSLGLRFQVPSDCAFAGKSLAFTANRLWNFASLSVVVLLSIFYPPAEGGVRFSYACDLLRRVSQNHYDSEDRIVFLIRTVNAELRSIIASRSEFRIVPCLSHPHHCADFLNRDFRYLFLIGVFNYKSDHTSRRWNLLYTNVQQTDWTTSWLHQSHSTPVGNRTFPGFYAAACASFVVFPVRFRILDFFDYFAKLDLDAPLEPNDRLYYDEFFPIRRMAAHRSFLFGCKVMLDSESVSQSVFKMIRSYLDQLEIRCGRSIRSASLISGLLRDQRQEIPGIFQQFWLGFFASAEVEDFAQNWFAFGEGHRIHRWGDQQYSFIAHALFSANASRTLILDGGVAGCTWYRFAPVW
jgi:hypothetical protein